MLLACLGLAVALFGHFASVFDFGLVCSYLGFGRRPWAFLGLVGAAFVCRSCHFYNRPAGFAGSAAVEEVRQAAHGVGEVALGVEVVGVLSKGVLVGFDAMLVVAFYYFMAAWKWHCISSPFMHISLQPTDISVLKYRRSAKKK